MQFLTRRINLADSHREPLILAYFDWLRENSGSLKQP